MTSQILITAEINELLLHQLTESGFAVDVVPFINTENMHTEVLRRKIEEISLQQATVIFTSSKAVKAVQHLLQNKKPAWKIYCVGNVTRLLIEKVFINSTVVAVADSAKELAAIIIAGNNKEAYFFCGDKRRNELPKLLAENNIMITEVEVYTTTIHRHKITKPYNAILFFSPSAAEGFFNSNAINDKTVLFAIGNTTADAIKKFSNNKIIVSSTPGKKVLVEKVISYFNSGE